MVCGVGGGYDRGLPIVIDPSAVVRLTDGAFEAELDSMPKNKSHKGLLKRIRISKTGKARHRAAGHKHLSSHKTGKRLRHLRKDRYMAGPDAKRLEKLLFRRLRGRNQPRASLKRSPSPEARAAMRAEAENSQD